MKAKIVKRKFGGHDNGFSGVRASFLPASPIKREEGCTGKTTALREVDNMGIGPRRGARNRQNL